MPTLYAQVLERTAVQEGIKQGTEYVVVHRISTNGDVRAILIRVQDQHICRFDSPDELDTACEEGRYCYQYHLLHYTMLYYTLICHMTHACLRQDCPRAASCGVPTAGHNSILQPSDGKFRQDL